MVRLSYQDRHSEESPDSHLVGEGVDYVGIEADIPSLMRCVIRTKMRWRCSTQGCRWYDAARG